MAEQAFQRSKSKKELLCEILSECCERTKDHNKKHHKLKKIDDIVDVIISCSSAVSICLLLSVVAIPVAIGLSGMSFVLGAISKSLNWKGKYLSHNQSSRNFSNLAREINTTLRRNHLTNDDLIEYMESVNARIRLIEENEI
jgi:hypothetical protein